MLNKLLFLSSLFVTIFILSACAVTTRSLEGTSETLANTTEALIGLTSSTFPNSKESGASELASKADRRNMAIKFASFNYEKIRRDASRGEGEYLQTLGDLMITSSESSEQFNKFLKANYEAIFLNHSQTNEQFQGAILITKIEEVRQKNS